MNTASNVSSSREFGKHTIELHFQCNAFQCNKDSGFYSVTHSFNGTKTEEWEFDDYYDALVEYNLICCITDKILKCEASCKQHSDIADKQNLSIDSTKS